MKTRLNVLLGRYKGGDTLADVCFDNLPFLSRQEPLFNAKGQRVSKSYFDTKGKEVIRITYDRIIGDHVFQGQTYNDVFLGISRRIIYLDWAGEEAFSKQAQEYRFKLIPVFVGDGTGTLTGFSSPKMEEILKQERIEADNFLKANNKSIYILLYRNYADEYNYYVKTGDKSDLLEAFDNETNPAILTVFGHFVYGSETLTIKDLILENLQ